MGNSLLKRKESPAFGEGLLWNEFGNIDSPLNEGRNTSNPVGWKIKTLLEISLLHQASLARFLFIIGKIRPEPKFY